MADEDYSVTLSADSTQYQQSLNQSVSTTNSLTAALGRAGEAMQGLWQRANRKLTFIAAGEVAAITAATHSAANLEQQMSQLQARQVMLHRDTNAYVSTVTNLRTGYGQTSAQAIQLVQQLNQLQVPFRAQQATAANYVKMAAVTGENVNGLAQSQQTFMRSMQASQGSVEKYSSMMSTLQQRTGASATATLDFANSIAPISKTLGLNQQQITGISAAFVKAGSDGGAAANVYTKVMSDINKAVQYGGPELKVYSELLGVSVDKFKAMPKAEVVTDIFEQLNKQGPQAIKTLEQLGLEGVRNQRAISSVMQQGGLRGAIGDATKGYGDTQSFNDAAKKAMSGLNDELGKTREAFTSIAQGIGSIFLPAMQAAVSVVNTLLHPLVLLSQTLMKLPTALKVLGSFGAAGLVAANFLPRMAAGLMGAGWVAQGLRGPLSQGVRAGFRGGATNQTQRDFLAGQGAAGPRTLFGAGRFLGRNVNPNTWIERFGGDPRNYQGVRGAAGGAARRALIGGMELTGSLVRGSMLPWQPAYLRNSAQMHLNKNIADSMMTTKSTWGEALRSGDGIIGSVLGGAKGQAGVNYVKPLQAQNAAVNASTKATQAHTAAVGQNKTILGTFGSQMSKLAGSSMGMIAGAGGMAARGIGRGAKFAGGLAMDALGGPAGLAMMGATAAVGYGTHLYNRYKSDVEATKPTTDDASVGSDYRSALGESSKALLSFSDAVKQATDSIGSSAVTMNQALKVTTADVTTAGRLTDVQTPFMENAGKSEATSYVSSLIRGGSTPQVMTAAKLDLIKRFGQTGAQQVLNDAGLKSGSAYDLYGNNQQGGVFLSKDNQATAPIVTSTILAQQGAASAVNPAEGARQYLSNFSGIASSLYGKSQPDESGRFGYYGQVDPNRPRRAADAANPVTMAAIRGFTGANGLDEKDVNTLRDSLNEFGKSVDVTKISNEDFQKQFGDFLAKQAKNNEWGSEQLRTTINTAVAQTGGVIPTTGQSSTDWATRQKQENPFGNYGDYDARQLIMGRSEELSRYMTFGPGGSSAAKPVLASMDQEQNPELLGVAATAMFHDAMTQAGGDMTQAALYIQKLGVDANDTSGNFKQIAAAAMQLTLRLQNVQAAYKGQNTMGEQAGRAVALAKGTIQEYQEVKANDPNDTRLPELRKNAEAAQESLAGIQSQIQDYMANLAQQYRSFYHQKDQGEKELNRNQTRMLRDFGIQQQQQEEDFNTSRFRNQENYDIQRSRSISDHHTQELRALSDFNKQRTREEEDHNLQLVRLAEDSAKSVYNIYGRVATERTWDAANLFQNMQEQQTQITQQKSNLDAIRKLGLSNKAVQQLGLADSGNAQQLTRLLQGLQENPDLINKYNQMAKMRQGAAGSLAMDEGNTGFQRGEEDRKKSLKHSQEDFDLSMDRQRSDFRKQLNRSSEDFSKAMGQAQSDYNKMRKRQKDNLELGFKDMRTDFKHQMEITLENISYYAEQIDKGFTANAKTVLSHTTGVTHDQVKLMTTYMGELITIESSSIDDLDTKIAGPYKKWNIQPGAKTNPGGTASNPSGHSPSNIPGTGGPNDLTVYESLGDAPSGGGDDNKHGWPLKSHKIGTPWGKKGSWSGSKTLGKGYHSGDDFPAPGGTHIFAAEDGKVAFTGWGGAYGNMTKISHGNGVQTWYAHQSKIDVKKGDEVNQGDHIGNVGETGRAFGTHLHFEVRVNGKDIDPKKWLGGASNPTGGGGGSSQSEPKPDFKGMTKPFEDSIAKHNYMSPNREWFHSGFYFKQGQLADAIAADFHKKWEDKYGADYSDPGGGGGGGIDSGGQGGSRGVWNALRTGGLTATQAAGVMGNIEAESGFKWNIHQRGGGTGYGLVQWSPGSKLTGAKGILHAIHKKDGLESQIAALFHQLAGKGPYAESHAGKTLRAADTVKEATRAFLRDYERAGDTSDSAVNRRNKMSENWYKKYHNAALPGGGDGGGSTSGKKGDKYDKALTWAKGESGKPYVFGGVGPHGYDCSGFMAAIQNHIEGKPLHHRRYSTVSFHGSKSNGFTRNKKSPFMVGVKPQSGRNGHMAGTLNGTHVESSGGKGVHYGKSARGYNNSMFSWRGGYGIGTNSAHSGWHWVGEHGPELRNFKGGETVLSAAQSQYAVMAAKAGQVVHTKSGSTTVNNNQYDHSVQVAHVEVKADNPRSMLQALEREARMTALTSAGKP